jgi:enoyl-CoA hydratase/carnithine racemase
MTTSVRSQRRGNYVTVTMCNPAKRNALSLDVLVELTKVFEEIGSSDALGVILAAEGPVFSAGHNFGEMKGASEADALHLFTVCSNLMLMMHSIPQPIVARVHALATAAGCQLVATCDLAVAATSAGFAIPGGKGGLFCHTPLVAVARSLPPKRALEMAMTGDVITAQTALEWGFINEVASDEELENATQSLVDRACRGSRESKALGKKAYYQQVGMNEAGAYAFASAVMANAVASDVAQEGITAFLEKRHPDFGGR